jgi:hypothetical protein
VADAEAMDGTPVICGAAVVASRERERGSWSGGRAETGHVSILKRPEARGRCSHDGAWARAPVAESERNGREQLEVEEGRRHVGPSRQSLREGRRHGNGCNADRAGPARKQTGEGKCGRAGRLGRISSRPTGPIGPEGGRGKENKFSFSNFIFQIHFPNVFESLLNFGSNQSIQ